MNKVHSPAIQPRYSKLLLIVTTLCWLTINQSYADSSATPSFQQETERLVPLSGTLNTRDMGGYSLEDGRQVRWGLLFRSDDLASLEDADLIYLKSLGLASIADFRSHAERVAAPDQLPQQSPPINYRTWAVNDPTLNVIELREQIFSGRLSNAELMKLGNRDRYITDRMLSREWGNWLASIAEPGNLPHLFHCTAGKDRTGFAAAILLLTIGVSPDQVMQDFLASNRYLEDDIERNLEKIQSHSEYVTNPQVLRQILGVNPHSLKSAISTMESTYGSIDGFIEHGLGIDAKTRQRLRQLLLEKATSFRAD